MPPPTLTPKSGSTADKVKQPSAATLKDGIMRPKMQNEGLKADTTKITVPVHNKLNAYLDTKSKDDPWSPYTMRSTTIGACGKEQK